MGLRDRYDNPLNTTSTDARDAYNRGLYLFLGANYGAVEAFEDAVAKDPGFALGHAGLARAHMLAGNPDGAKAALAKAQELADPSDAREAGHMRALALVLSGQAAEARRAVRAHVRDFPRDALCAQLCMSVFGLIGFSGEVGREADLLGYCTQLAPHYGDDWWMMSMQALAMCETGQIDASMRLMEKSLAINPRNANGSHFKAHALYEAGDSTGGRAYLAEWMAEYDPRAGLHGHLSWHQALWALHDGEPDLMWQIVDSAVAPGAAQGLPINVLTDTAALLFRAEVAGHNVAPSRWAMISDYAAQTFPKAGQSFADVHAALSHAMAGEGDRLAALAEAQSGFAADLVRPLARAWAAMARQNWAKALEELVPVMSQTERLGGSRAQRDLIELAYVQVLLKLGQTDEARRSLMTRRQVLATAPPVAAMH